MSSVAEQIRIKKDERARKQESADAKIAIFRSQFKKDDKKINEEDPELAVEYYVDVNGEAIRNVYFKNPKENLEPLRKVEAQGYRYEMLTPSEKELAYGLYRPLPDKLRKKLGITVKAGKRIRKHKKTRKGRGKGKYKGKKSYSFRVKR